MAKFCTNCGTPIKEGSLFCDNCCARLDGAPAPAAQPPVQQPQQYDQPIPQQYQQPQQYEQPPVQPQYQQPQYAYPQPAQQPKKKTGLLIGLIVGGGTCCGGNLYLTRP